METTTIITLDNLDTVTPCDMRREAEQALSSGQETAIEYRVGPGSGVEGMHYIFFPSAGRGGVCCGGDSEWTDASSMDDLEDRWINYEERWSN